MKHLPIDDNMNGIIEEDEMEEEGSDFENDDNEENEWKWTEWTNLIKKEKMLLYWRWNWTISYYWE